MSNTITTTPVVRPTVRMALDEIAAVRADVATLTRVVTDLAGLVAQGQAHTSAAVAEATVTAIGDAPSAKPARKPRKASGRKATVQEAAQATVHGLPTIAEAHKLVDAGGDPWKIKVLSATTGKPIPFKLVMQAEAHASATSTPASKPAAKPARKGGRKATISAEDAKRVFVLGGKALAALAAEGDKAAQAEIDRRAAKHAK